MKEALILGILSTSPNGEVIIEKNEKVETYQKYEDIVIEQDGGVYQKLGEGELLTPEGNYCYTVGERFICN